MLRRLVLVGMFVAACGGKVDSRRLIVTSPAVSPGQIDRLCLGDDKSNTLDGLQINITVEADGFSDGATLLLSLDGAEPDPQVAATVTANTATFSNYTVPQGVHSIIVESEDKKIASPAIQVNVDTNPPSVAFVSLTDQQVLDPVANDADPNTPGTQVDVQVFANVEDGQSAKLTITDPDGQDVSPAAVTVTSQHATIPVTFAKVGGYSLRLDSSTACGNPGSTLIHVFVQVGGSCKLSFNPAPTTVNSTDWLNYASDADHALAGWQGQVVVSAGAGGAVALTVNGNAAGTQTADSSGKATFQVTLAEGTAAVSASCTSGTKTTTDSHNVSVDVTPPTCAISAPADGAVLTPQDDLDPSTSGTQFAIQATVGGGDTDGEQATITVDTSALQTTVASGAIDVVGSLTQPGTNVPITLSAVDHAQNSCTQTIHVSHVTNGCTISWTSPDPSQVITSGVAIDVTATLGADCAGKQVTLSGCDVGGDLTATSGTGATPTATFPGVTLCASAQCDTIRTCTLSVTNDAGLTSSQTTSIHVDTQPPVLATKITQPSGVSCGATITSAADVDSSLAGVQIDAQAIGVASTKWFIVQPDPGSSTQIPVDGTGTAEITLTDGANTITAFGTDANGNQGQSPDCTLTLSSLALSINSPTGTVGPKDFPIATPFPPTLQVQVCGNVGQPSVATVGVVVDSTGFPATVDTTTGDWCITAALADGVHSVTATASAGGASAMATSSFTVDLTPPDITSSGFAALGVNRNTIDVSWTAPADGTGPVDHCDLKDQLDKAIADQAAFDALPVAATLAGVTPGQVQTQSLSPFHTGETVYFAIECSDAYGNHSTMQTASGAAKMTLGTAFGPAAIGSMDVSNANFGSAVAAVDLNNDGVEDLVVGAPGACNVAGCEASGLAGAGAVYIYLGAKGAPISSTPSFVIASTDGSDSTELGHALAMVDWNHDGIQDLAVSAPESGGTFQGVVYIYFGGKTVWSTPRTTPLTEANADVTITPGTNAWFGSFPLMGTSIAAVNFDGDTHTGGLPDDLVIGVPTAGTNFAGGAVVVFAPSVLGLSIDLSALVGTSAIAIQFEDAAFQPWAQMGEHIHALGNVTGGAEQGVLIGGVSCAAGGGTAGTNCPTGSLPVYAFYGAAQPALGTFATMSYTSADEVVVPDGDATHEALGVWGGSVANASGGRDLVVGDSLDTTNSAIGHVFVMPSTGGTLTAGTDAKYALSGSYGQSFLGVGVANDALGMGADVDGDGVEDVVASTNNENGVVRVYASFGSSASYPIASATVGGGSLFSGQTTLVQWAGDLNNDGQNDLVWADNQSGEPSAPGVVEVLY